MRNKSIIVGVAVGVAALTAAGILMSKMNKSKKNQMSDGESQLADTFKHKLNHLQRKAQKELKVASADGSDVSNMAKERANQWVSKSSANL
ncbi:MAG TPA: hypothetical protein VF676_04490 [Flavobacterium sp.]|jgi:gas vesicle protein